MAASPGQHWAQTVVSTEAIALHLGKLREVDWGEVGIRFAFGAAVSLVAGVVGVLVGAAAGGLWLAFPAILPAGLTLVEHKENRRQAERLHAAGQSRPRTNRPYPPGLICLR
jgi:hypothetical protein